MPTRAPSEPGGDRPEGGWTPKGERTRTRILDAALARLEAHGYEATTMRAIAEDAGVSLGNAYHYFPSKEALLQGFYARTHEEHLAACGDALDRETEFGARLRLVMDAKLRSIARYHRVAGAMFAAAADPASPLNPFSPESAEVRRQSAALFAQVVAGSRTRIHPEIRERLPDLLWTWHMAIVLFWVHDRSPRQERTRRLLERSLALVVRLVALASNPLLRPLRKMAIDLIDEVTAAAVAPEPPRDGGPRR
jgi:AcrR family transcriptional regulator